MPQLKIQPTFDLAVRHHQAGRLQEARQLYEQILAQQPRHAPALHYLGVLSRQAGRYDQAVDLIRRSLSIAPYTPEAYYNLGNALRDNSQPDEAVAAYRQAIALDPGYAIPLNNLGNILIDQGHTDDALAVFRQAITLQPRAPEPYNNLGVALIAAKKMEEAAAAFRQALAINPFFSQALIHLGDVLQELRQPDAAIAMYQKALPLEPDFHELHNKLGVLWKDKGKLDQAIAHFRQALALNPNLVNLHNNLLYTLSFHPATTPESTFAEYQIWNRQFAQPLRHLLAPHSNNPDPHRPLRIGYVSPDFCEHPVGRFLLPLLESHDRSSFHITCYANLSTPDAFTDKLKSHADTWRDILPLPDDQVAEMIRRDQIDILVDLSLHLNANRLNVFAHKPAPVQVTYLGHVGGTALDTIDYRLTDPYLNPDENEDRCYMEKSLRLQGTYWCYQPLASAPPVSALPALSAGHLTFACLNNFCKITPPTLEAWASLLLQVPSAHLLLYSVPGNHLDELGQFMESRGLSPDRLEILGRRPLKDYFQTYHRIDIALDPFPYNGGTTTCDALWMGVPVITLAGHTPVARAGVSILTNAGLPEFIARSPEQYIQLAATLAQDLPRLTHLRATLRDRLQSSRLMNAPAFTRSIEAAYRTMWQTWCSTNTK